MRIALPLCALKRLLLATWAFFVVAGFFAEMWRYVFDERTPLSRFFSLSHEQNAPTWYASCLLLLCALNLALIALAKTRDKARYAAHWWFLAGVFAYISLDETAEIHESASTGFDFSGFLYFGWVIPATVVVTVIGSCYLRFLSHLPRSTRWRFVAAGAIYVGGALGVEFLLGYWTDLAGRQNLTYGLIDLVQESMELAGVSLFLCSLVEYLAGPSGQLQLVFSDGQESLEPQANESRSPWRVAS